LTRRTPTSYQTTVLKRALRERRHRTESDDVAVGRNQETRDEMAQFVLERRQVMETAGARKAL